MNDDAIDGAYVVARVGGHLFAVDIDSVDAVRPGPGEERPDAEAEELLGLDRDRGERMRLCMSRGPARAELAVPRTQLEIGRHLRGRCHAPRLVAAVLERCCLQGVVLDGDRLVYLLDVGRFWSRLPNPRHGESS